MSLPQEVGSIGSTADAVVEELAALADRLTDTLKATDFAGYSDDEVLQVTAALEGLTRVVDPLSAAAAGEIGERSQRTLGNQGLALRKGCRNANTLLQRVTRVSGPVAAQRLSLGSMVRNQMTLTGAVIPPVFPRVAAAFTAGLLGSEAARMILQVLDPARARVGRPALWAAEAELVDAALGRSEQFPIPASVDELRAYGIVCRAQLDPDGAEPDEDRAWLQRGLHLGAPRDGLIPVRGALVPEVAGQLQVLLQATMNPRTGPVEFLDADPADLPPDPEMDTTSPLSERPAQLTDNPAEVYPGVPRDPRSPDQIRHDAFAMILGVAARSAEAPRIGGAVPTIIVTVRQADLDRQRGVGHIDGIDAPISIRTVKQLMCSGITRLAQLDDAGRLVKLTVGDRCFTAEQRKAILARDGGCIIPGCSAPAAMTEIHHARAHAHDGPTSTDNGCLLCWPCHRNLVRSGWDVRMRDGVPEVRAPAWIDPRRIWMPSTKSPTRLADRLDMHRDRDDL